jgi:UDP-glucose 4-epimerase
MIAEIDKWHDAPLWDAESIARATRPWFDHLGSKEIA